MQISYNSWKLKAHKGSGTVLVVLPYLYRKRHKVKAGDTLYLIGDEHDGPPTLLTENEYRGKE